MKRTIAFLFLALAAVARAQAPSITQSAEYPWRLQAVLTYDGSGTITAAPITQFYRTDLAQGGTVLTSLPSPIPSLTVDLVANGAKTVVVGGVTYTYSQAIQIVSAILAQERAAQLAAGP